jgi:hypothetical protein
MERAEARERRSCEAEASVAQEAKRVAELKEQLTAALKVVHDLCTFVLRYLCLLVSPSAPTSKDLIVYAMLSASTQVATDREAAADQRERSAQVSTCCPCRSMFLFKASGLHSEGV